MRHFINSILTCILLLITSYSWAKPIDQRTALTVAEHFINMPVKDTNGLIRTPKKPIKLTLSDNQITNNQSFYIFKNTDGRGYVIVSADDIALPILGFSETGNAENMPDNLRWWLSEYDREIQWAINHGIESTEETTTEWKKLKANTRVKSAEVIVSPLIQTEWSQGTWYNSQCPYDANTGSYCATGCVATAMAQIMKYWEFPTKGRGYHYYYDDNYGLQYANFANTTYNWASMPIDLGILSSSTSIDAVATLMYHCGVSVEMDYGIDESGAQDWRAREAFHEYFWYSDEAQLFDKDDYTLSQWQEKLKSDLYLDRPIFYSGSGNQGGHAFVCDGYRSDNYFHFNWGWDECDGYYSLTALTPSSLFSTQGNFTSEQTALLKLYPKTDTISRVKLEMEEEINISDSIICGNSWYFSTIVSNVGFKSFSGYIYAVVYDKTLFNKVIIDSIYCDSLSYECLYFNLDSAVNLSKGTYYVSMEYRDENTGDLTWINSDYYSNIKRVVVCDKIEMDFVSWFVWKGDKEHWYIGDSIRFITQINNNDNIPFTGDICIKLVNINDSTIYQFFDITNNANEPILAHDYNIIHVDGKLVVPEGSYHAYFIYRETSTDEWQLVGCASGFENPMSLEIEIPQLIHKYVILAQRNTTSNWYYLTNVNAGSERTPHLEAVNSGTTDRSLIQTSNLEDKYIWIIETDATGILLKNSNEYVSYTSGNTAHMSETGQSLSVTNVANDLVQYWFVDNSNVNRYLSLNTQYDYFSFYKGTQAQNLLVLEYQNSNVSTHTKDIETDTIPRKILRNGQILIIRGDKTYNIQGQVVQ